MIFTSGLLAARSFMKAKAGIPNQLFIMPRSTGNKSAVYKIKTVRRKKLQAILNDIEIDVDVWPYEKGGSFLLLLNEC